MERGSGSLIVRLTSTSRSIRIKLLYFFPVGNQQKFLKICKFLLTLCLFKKTKTLELELLYIFLSSEKVHAAHLTQ